MTLNESAILNWDEETNPTPLCDIAFNIAHHVATKHGWGAGKVGVLLTHKVLIIKVWKTATFGRGKSFGSTCDGHWSTEVHVDLTEKIPREITGRIASWLPVGLYDLSALIKGREEA